MYMFFGSEAIFRSVCRSRGLSTAVNLSAVFTFHRFCALLVTPSPTLLKCFTANTFYRLPFMLFLFLSVVSTSAGDGRRKIITDAMHFWRK